MTKLTGNNKDYLFKTSNFIKEIVLLEDVEMTILQNHIKKFVAKLVDDIVIDESSIDETEQALIQVMSVMLNNPKVGKFGDYIDE